MKICPKCKKEHYWESKFCTNDGSVLLEPDKFIPKCVKCGKVYDEGVRFCSDDGGKIIAEAYRKAKLINDYDTSNIGEITKTVGAELKSVVEVFVTISKNLFKRK